MPSNFPKELLNKVPGEKSGKKNKAKLSVLSRWLPLNGVNLDLHSGENWVCLFTHSMREFTIAYECARSKLPFFLPLLEDSTKDAFQVLWPNYIFCRMRNNQLPKSINRLTIKVLKPADEAKLIGYLDKFSSFNSLTCMFNKDDVVRIITGSLKGVKCKVIEHNNDSTVKLTTNIMSRPVVFDESIDYLEVVNSKYSHVKVMPLDYQPSYAMKENIQDQLKLELVAINDELIKYLSKHPHYLYNISPRKFEELVAEIFRDMGYRVQLTPISGDGGRDILAILRIPHGEILTIIECKRYKKDRKIGPNIVERFLWTIDRYDNASCGLIATTAYFSSGARAREKEYHYKLKLEDFDGIQDWLDNYGTWSVNEESGIWIPKTKLIPQRKRSLLDQQANRRLPDDVSLLK